MSKVVLVKDDCYSYYTFGSFRPSEVYPEYPFDEIGEGKNKIYEMVRKSFYMMGLDADNFGRKEWNPLKAYIKPGDTVLLKPNLVMDYNQSGEGTDCLFTQPSVVAAVLDYVYIALQGNGKIIVGDAPMQECNFEKLVMESGYDRLIKYYSEKCSRNIQFEFVDFRGVTSTVSGGVHYYNERVNNGTVIDLGDESEFGSLNAEQYENMRITNYDPALLLKHHSSSKNEYCISNYILEADVIINMPKPKTHRKAGVTISMKNLVGINSRKEYLPHHTKGASDEQGDEYLSKSRLKRFRAWVLDKRNYHSQTSKKYKYAKFYGRLLNAVTFLIHFNDNDKFAEGSWYGNKTISKTIVDLNKILFYADKNGVMRESVQRKYFIVADMIVSGEKEGPVAPSPKKMGVVAMGDNPVFFDEVIAKLMGAKIENIDTINCAKIKRSKYNLINENDARDVISNDERYNKTLEQISEEDLFYFIPTEGWKKVFYKKRNGSNNEC